MVNPTAGQKDFTPQISNRGTNEPTDTSATIPWPVGGREKERKKEKNSNTNMTECTPSVDFCTFKQLQTTSTDFAGTSVVTEVVVIVFIR